MAKAVINIKTNSRNCFSVDITNEYKAIKSREHLLETIISKLVRTNNNFSRLIIKDCESERTTSFPLASIEYIDLEGIILDSSEETGELLPDNIEIFPITGGQA